MEAFPAHCDCLALANMLAFQLHREDSFDRTGSASHGHSSGNLDSRHQNGATHNNSGNIDMSTSNGGSTAGNVATEMDRAVQNVSRSHSVSA